MTLGIIACSSDDNKQSNEFEIVTLEINTIVNSYMSGAGQENIGQENKVVTDLTELEALIDRIDYIKYGNDTIVELLENADIDFEREMIIAVFDEVKNHGGYSIDITKVEEHEKEILVTIERLHRGDLTAHFTQPLHIVKISKINKPVVFVEID
ncbi:protease complex subunit PrcB family protein [Myroides indicus]|uniref:Protease stability complex PrcB-like protein n=1 Tax=Myroides indicus TaxID=1323422 RepID=A0A4R7F2F6_9FLAO|nr:protease complex subunit PrcB family protein [Myroides indicus]TDS58867.1 protease stability complex PrcB-like protein [Myroides indicus]